MPAAIPCRLPLVVLFGTVLLGATGVWAQEPARQPPHRPPAHPVAPHPVAHHPVPHRAVRIAPPHAAAGHAPATRPAARGGTHPGIRPANRAAPVHRAAAPPPPVPVVPVAPPAPPPAPPKGSNTGLPLPRFAALRAEIVNMRSGPGTRYPIAWVYKRRDLPVQIEREFDVWRLVEDSEGVKGWVHQATLVGTRTFVIPPAARGSAFPVPPPGGGTEAAAALVPAGAQAMRAAAQPDAAVVAILKPGVVGRIRACPAGSGWCRVSIRDYSGWLPRSAFWGLLPDETILPP